MSVDLKQWVEDYKYLHKIAKGNVASSQQSIKEINDNYGLGLITTDEWYNQIIAMMMHNSQSSEKHGMIKQLIDDPIWPEATEESIKTALGYIQRFMLVSHDVVS